MAILLTVQNRDVVYVDCKDCCVGCSYTVIYLKTASMLFYIIPSTSSQVTLLTQV